MVRRPNFHLFLAFSRNYPARSEKLHIVKYGTPKNRAAKNRTGVLIDDELQRWNVEKLVDANNFYNILNVENLWSCLFSLASE